MIAKKYLDFCVSSKIAMFIFYRRTSTERSLKLCQLGKKTTFVNILCMVNVDCWGIEHKMVFLNSFGQKINKRQAM